MLGRVILFFVLIPLIELVLLHQLLNRAGLLVTLGMVFATGIVGVSLARQQGFRVWRSIHEQLSQGKTPSGEILSGVMILLAGAFLITPGVVTDTCGFLLLVPRIRLALGAFLFRWFRTRTVATFQAHVWSRHDAGTDEIRSEQPTVRVLDPDLPKVKTTVRARR
jgi:UPF0716 protein FxsA